ncbi:MAG: hypothetical protein ACJAZ2_001743 [Glaciecola sp.]|jgi:hypothetical protein
MIKNTLVIAFLALFIGSHAQTPNFSEHVAPIIYNNCSSCHHEGGIGPFSLMSYDDAVLHSTSIAYEVEHRTMPPWPADTIDVGFVHERDLTDAQIETIVNWVAGNTLVGDESLAPKVPVFSSNSVLSQYDLQVNAPHYRSKAVHNDDYVCFTIPTSLATDQWIEAIEVVPGNPEIVHHCLVFIDADTSYSADTTSGQCSGPTESEILVGQYVPGSSPVIFPNDGKTKFGVKLQAGAQLILAMHYPKGSEGMLDSTKVNIHFYDDPVGVRSVRAEPIINSQEFCIDSGAVHTEGAQFPYEWMVDFGIELPKYSVLAFFPHMHLLGEEISTWAITPTNDTIDLGSVSHWDYEWQGFYVYKKLKIIPAGSKIYGKATYHNTEEKYLHHSDPNEEIHVKEVCEGPNTTDEMFLIYYQFLDYVDGDEDLNIDSILSNSTLFAEDTVSARSVTVPNLNISPNPLKKSQNLKIGLPHAGNFSIDISDLNGQVIYREKITGTARTHTLNATFSAGVYLISLRNKTELFTTKLVVR